MDRRTKVQNAPTRTLAIGDEAHARLWAIYTEWNNLRAIEERITLRQFVERVIWGKIKISKP